MLEVALILSTESAIKKKFVLLLFEWLVRVHREKILDFYGF